MSVGVHHQQRRGLTPQFPPPMTAKEASAEAKAAIARAKALRPWYRRDGLKIVLLIGFVLAIAVAGASNKTSNPASSTRTMGPPATPSVGGVAKGFASADAVADVTGYFIGERDFLGRRDVTLTVTNHSSERSDYSIAFSIDSADGMTQYDTSFASIDDLGPGQTVVADAASIGESVPDGAIVTLKKVQRFASN